MTNSDESACEASVSHVLVVGEHGTPHFESTKAVFSLDAFSIAILETDALDEATLSTPSADTSLIVFAENRRDQFNESCVDQIRLRFPLSRIIFVQSDWCTGKFLPHETIAGVTYVRHGRWQSTFRRIFDQSGSVHVHDSVPETASQIELQIANSDHLTNRFEGMRVAIAADAPSDQEATATMVTELGGQSVLIDSDISPHSVLADLIIYCCIDPNRVDAARSAELRSLLAENVKATPIWLLTNFPRIGDVELLIEHGFERVIAQPFQLDEL